MKPIGEVIKKERLKKKISVSRLSEITKIRREFIIAIEKGDWASLPEFPVVMGFAKNIAEALDIGVGKVAALLKRDYPPRALNINPKPDVAKAFVWSPKLTFFVGIAVVTVILFGYLIYQYVRFVSPPELYVDSPQDGQMVAERQIVVKGRTDLEASVKVNNQPVVTGDDGQFEAEIEVSEATSEVIVVARSRSGKETVINRGISVNLESTE